MGVQKVTVQLVRGGLQGILADALKKLADPAADGILTKAHLGLFTAWPGFSEDMVAADLTEATYGGYARQLAVFGAPDVDVEGRSGVIAASLTFLPTDSTAASRCLGVGIYDASVAGNLIGVGKFDSNVMLATPADTAVIVLKIAMPIDAADWGVGAMVN